MAQIALRKTAAEGENHSTSAAKTLKETVTNQDLNTLERKLNDGMSDCMGNGNKVKILLMNPYSEVLLQRQEEINRGQKDKNHEIDLFAEINAAINKVNTIVNQTKNKGSMKRGSIELRLYNDLPRFAYFKTREKIRFANYPIGKSIINAETLVVNPSNDLSTYLREQFNELWEYDSFEIDLYRRLRLTHNKEEISLRYILSSQQNKAGYVLYVSQRIENGLEEKLSVGEVLKLSKESSTFLNLASNEINAENSRWEVSEIITENSSDIKSLFTDKYESEPSIIIKLESKS